MWKPVHSDTAKASPKNTVLHMTEVSNRGEKATPTGCAQDSWGTCEEFNSVNSIYGYSTVTVEQLQHVAVCAEERPPGLAAAAELRT
jgi:hypothetical protein